MRANMQQLMAKSFSYPVYVLAWRSWSHGFPTGGVTCFREGMVEYPCDASSYGNGRLQCLNSDHLDLHCLMRRPIFYKFMWLPIYISRTEFQYCFRKKCSGFNNIFVLFNKIIKQTKVRKMLLCLQLFLSTVPRMMSFCVAADFKLVACHAKILHNKQTTIKLHLQI